MKEIKFRYYTWAISVMLLLLITAGCASPSTETVETALPNSQDVESPLEPLNTAVPTPESVSDKDVLYQDDFTEPSSSWPEEAFDNYFIGYHEPDYYHVQVLSPNYKTLVFIPDKPNYGDVTIDLKVFTEGAADGDFRYGLVFHRSGDQYYAFTISPRTKTWYVLKSSSNALEVLKEGTNDSIQGLEAADILRVDIQGSTFFFHINDQLVDQINDPDYVDGEVGFFVQSFESPSAHIHFDTLTVRNVETPLLCSVNAETMNMRSGPGTDYPSIAILSQGESVAPFERTFDEEWIHIRVNDKEYQQGWIASFTEFVSCNAAITNLPVIGP